VYLCVVGGCEKSNPFELAGLLFKIKSEDSHHSPTNGRFAAEDPIKDKLNWYGYSNTNQLSFVDPSGLTGISPNAGVMVDYDRNPVYAIGADGIPRRIDPLSPIYVTDGQRTVQQSFSNVLNIIELIMIRANASHEAYTTFRTKENAMLAWALTFHPLSGPDPPRFPQGSEHFSWLYRTPYGYTFGHQAPDNLRGENYIRLGVPRTRRGYELIGWIHTHPISVFSDEIGRQHGYGARGMELFSYRDGMFSQRSDVQVPGYLVTPNGELKRLDLEWSGSRNVDGHIVDLRYVSFISRNIFSN